MEYIQITQCDFYTINSYNRRSYLPCQIHHSDLIFAVDENLSRDEIISKLKKHFHDTYWDYLKSKHNISSDYKFDVDCYYTPLIIKNIKKI